MLPLIVAAQHFRYGQKLTFDRRRRPEHLLDRHRRDDFVFVQPVREVVWLGHGLDARYVQLVELGDMRHNGRKLPAILLQLLVRQIQPRQVRHVTNFIQVQQLGHRL